MREKTEAMLPAVAQVLDAPERLGVLQAAVPDMSVPDEDFDGLARLAASLFDAPIALVSLVDREWQWFKACIGTTETRSHVRESFCVHTIAAGDGGPFLVLDASRHPAFRHRRAVGSPPFVRFYGGAPIVLDGQAIGTVAVLDVEPRSEVSAKRQSELQRIAGVAASLFKLKDEARRRALKEAALSREEQRLAMALDAANVGSWLWDIRAGTVSGNGAMMRMFGLPPERTVGAKAIFSAIHPEDRIPTFSKLRQAMAANEEYDGMFRIGTNGRWLLGRGRVHDRDSKGAPLSFLGMTIDVSDQQASVNRTRLLLKELNHRVKNTLAMLQSLARQTLRQTSDPAEFMTAFAGRLQAISEAHGLLSDYEWGTIHLSELISKQLLPYVSDYSQQVELHKDEILLGPDQAVGLGLVLHELATNAVKYGALSVPTGKIVLTARRVVEDGESVLHLTWTEVGGPPIREPRRRGFGSILIERSLDKIIGSSVKVEYLPAGVTALIRLPL
ncbi:sensor histidine kinase [Sinorhizobium meliloti]|uniref:sensor histidine kinase n=1 Tax=Rhizobium meliloti TaxID=382 RepID=UPI000FD805F2|nr:HWE histidine kinase domain-containing protein [Sinorhizobium meliloti]RVG75437.1 PAS domain S-box protein [Sinorhizobium meliloti]RVI24492.1 PAS domain S-box protein [Sinorhizobium meliloti]RVI38208.1 PAS domain S-box protein [Sinorhizobium meliloti]RVJ17037.1 PAS domain S-box protein [Sinorhizobium meliloti]RVJ92134.1 PAS domain S-box protein [Sinorhizobium meliloti]